METNQELTQTNDIKDVEAVLVPKVKKIDWEHATGRDLYFKPEINRDYDLLAVEWTPVDMPSQDGDGTKPGIQLKLMKIDKDELADKPKTWTITGKRLIRELEPVVTAAEGKGLNYIYVRFRKSLGRGQQATEAVFSVQNLDPKLKEELARLEGDG